MEKNIRSNKSSAGLPSPADRLEVLKTYKLYIGGQFPRTESGRYVVVKDPAGRQLANICLSSRKDLREAVVAARNAFKGWSARAAFNRSQILYRVAEMLESRRSQFVEELQAQGLAAEEAQEEVNLSVDRLVYYAGWCDKYQQVFGSVNPVASAHFNFSVPEPTGVVVAVTDPASALLGTVSLLAPAIAGGNTVILLVSGNQPLSAISLAEVIHSSDVPGGVVNILTGTQEELAPVAAAHMDINALVYAGGQADLLREIQLKASANVKRIIPCNISNWRSAEAQGPYFILDTQEIKTTWHPIENTGGAGAKY